MNNMQKFLPVRCHMNGKHLSISSTNTIGFWQQIQKLGQPRSQVLSPGNEVEVRVTKQSCNNLADWG